MTNTPPAAETVRPERDHRSALRYVEEALRGLKYGTLTIIVQDGVVVQVERTERRRFQRGGRDQDPPCRRGPVG
jgi:hypothetical protein